LETRELRETIVSPTAMRRLRVQRSSGDSGVSLQIPCFGTNSLTIVRDSLEL
jgi:hypothetical protein